MAAQSTIWGAGRWGAGVWGAASWGGCKSAASLCAVEDRTGKKCEEGDN